MLLKLMGLMAIIMAIMSGVFYWYYNDTQEKIAILNQNNAKIEAAAQICENTVSAMQQNAENLNKELSRINTNFAEIRTQNSVLAKKLEKHDIGVLGEAKPALVGRIINNAVEKSSRCIEILSGAKLTDKELAATSAKSFNSECPWLWPGDK